MLERQAEGDSSLVHGVSADPVERQRRHDGLEDRESGEERARAALAALSGTDPLPGHPAFALSGTSLGLATPDRWGGSDSLARGSRKASRLPAGARQPLARQRISSGITNPTSTTSV